jgi:tryptophanyl-tRNA synthetase
MSADILLYNTNEVPVGEDQKQHIELARDIAIRMNSLYKQNLFILPEAKISPVKRVMSLKDATKKMSKSDPAEGSRINLTDTPDEIVKKISKATTGELSSPEVANLQAIYREVSGRNYNFSQNPSFAIFKKELAEVLIAELEPISTKFKMLMNERGELERILLQNGDTAKETALKKITEVRNAIGF